MSSVGRFDFTDGGIYSGALHDGAAEGLGLYVGPDGRGEYSGSWRGGFEESGVYRWSGGESCYEGQWLHGRRHGLGVEQLEGWLYRGEWTQGFKGRYGLRQSTRTGAKYEGSWIVGKQDGYGVETYADGGTYEGQWLRGVRHGYGVRQSVSYDLALRYHQSNALPSTPLPSPDGSPINPHGHDPLLSTRDRRIEQGRAGGFVLVADLREKDLDKRGRTGLRGTLRLIRQRSTGDIEDPTRLGVRGAPAVGGSVRSTVSTGRGKGRSTSRGGGSRDEDEEEEWGSFVSLVGDTRFREDIVERYWGEWKNDRRSGYGICERSDGVKYEGEWLNNKKNGYGVTTLRDGTRLSGKYRRNVLLSSTSDVKPFLMRTGRLKEQVENATKEAEHAARVVLDRAQIAQTRTISARIKADEAHLEAGRAESMAEAARAQAQNNANAVFEPGSQIFMNCLREEDFLISSGSAAIHNPDTTNPIPSLHGQHSTKPHVMASKFLSLFRPKRRSLQQMPANTIDFESPSANHTTAKYYSATGSTSLPFRGHDLANRDLVSRMNASTVSPGSSTDVGGGIRSRDREFGHQRQGILSNEHTVNHDIFSRPETITAAIAPKLGSAAAQPEVRSGALLPRSAEDVVNQSNVFRGFEGHPEVSSVTLPTFSRFRDQTGSNDSPQRHRAPPGRRRAHAQIALPTLSPTASTEDGAPVDFQPQFRRKSLPSIIKEPVFPSSTTKPTPANQSTTTSGRKPEVNVISGLRPERQTIVIEDGVRKRVTPVYGARSPVRALAVGGRAGLPKLYSMEATTSGGHGRGSVPDLTEAALEGVEVPPREVVYALSQQRREELIRERMEANRRRGGQIILRLGDVKDWCARRKMLIILLAVNYALVSVFYNLLQQQEPQEPPQS